MSEFIRPKYGVSRVSGDTLALLEDEERRCLDLSILQVSVLRQMCFPWARYPERLVNEYAAYWEIVDQPVAYQEALEELEILLSGAYDGPIGGCPVGEIFVDRGDPSAWDFDITAFIADNTWRSLNLASVITDDDAYRVEIYATFLGSSAGSLCGFRTYQNQNAVNVLLARTQTAALWMDLGGRVQITPNQDIEYLLSPSVTAVYVTLRGWWKPAA